MQRDRRIPWRWLIALAIIAVPAVLLAMAVRRGELPEGPEPVAWNHQACAHCGMLVGEPRHAAQLVTSDGAVEFFDDPGCLVRFVDEHRVEPHRMWFHGEGNRWISADDVGFLPGAATPMGYGWIAVPRETPNALDLAGARRQVAGAVP
jgi:hypothetical protein